MPYQDPSFTVTEPAKAAKPQSLSRAKTSTFAIARDILWQAVVQLHAYPLRSGLTALGVTIAIAGVVAIASTMTALERGVNSELAGLGEDLVTTAPNWIKLSNGIPVEAPGPREMRALSQHAQGLRSVTASTDIQAANGVAFMGKPYGFTVVAVSPEWGALYRPSLRAGRLLQASDENARLRVALINQHAATSMGFETPELALGAILNVGALRLKIIGVIAGGKGQRLPQHGDILLPLGLASELGVDDPAYTLGFRLIDVKARDKTLGEVALLLRQSMNTPTGQEDDVMLDDARKQREVNQLILRSIAAVLMGVVSISLVIGAVGIMNVALVSVAERTHEIGLQRALGATRRHIQLQFLAESVLLCLVGAALGTFVGWGFAEFAVLFIPFAAHATLPLWAVGLSMGIAILVGLLSGAMPAAKAAALDPAAALASE